MARREYAEQKYREFRSKVRNRDGHKCMWPNCGKHKYLNVHHILPWHTYPLLRYEVNNGITLCRKHHKIVTGSELAFAKFLNDLIK